MAVVRRGKDLRLGRTVAVKTLRGELTGAPAFQARFRREARAAAALDHPTIVRVYDAGEEVVDGASSLYIVMEYVDGQTLSHLLRSGPRLTARRALEIAADVLAALDASHRAGIVHRDVKPGNVMITPSGTVKVMDFGVARAIADMSSSITQTATVIGTAQYLSPEQARGASVDARSDVYSAGCLLFELLTGRPPFQGDSAVAVAYQHVRETPPPPSEFEPDVTPEIDAVVLAALAKQPDQRYQSAADMRSDILAVLAGEPPAVPLAPAGAMADASAADDAGSTAVGALAAVGPDPAGEPSERPGRRRRIAYLAAAAAVLVIALGGFALSGLGGPESQPPAGDEAPGQTRVPLSRDSSEPAASPEAELDDPDGYEPVRRTGGADEAPEQSATGREARPTDGDSDTQQPTQDASPTGDATSTAPAEPTASEPEETASTSPPPDTTEPSPSESETEVPTSSPSSE